MQNIDKQQVKREISDWGFLNAFEISLLFYYTHIIML